MWEKFGWKGKSLKTLPTKSKMLLLLLVGLLLLVIAFPDGSSKQKSGQTQTEDGNSDSGDFGADAETYARQMEKKLEETLERVEGVGKVTVMITLKSDGEKMVEKDIRSSSQSVTEEDSTGGKRETKEQSSDRTSVYDQTESGQSPYVREELMPEVEGILIAAQGGDDPVTAREITEAAQALFGVEAHKIKIMKRENP